MWYFPHIEGDLLRQVRVDVDRQLIVLRMEVLEIPAAKYAIFALDSQGDALSQDAYIQAIKDLWQYIFKEWFPGSGYRHDEKCNFELYSGNVMQIYVPVCLK